MRHQDRSADFAAEDRSQEIVSTSRVLAPPPNRRVISTTRVSRLQAGFRAVEIFWGGGELLKAHPPRFREPPARSRPGGPARRRRRS